MNQRKYSEEFKQEAVRLSHQPGRSIRIVCVELGISRSTLHHWRQQRLHRQSTGGRHRARTAETGPASDQQVLVDAEEFRQMKRELELARQERDMLKSHRVFRSAAEPTIAMKVGFIARACRAVR